MKPLYRLILVALALVLFFVLFCIVYLESLTIQLAMLLIVILFSAWTFSAKGLIKKIYHLLPFILLLFGVYLIFAVFQIGKSRAHWIHYGLTRTTLLLSSLLFMQVLINWLRIDSFLDFPIGIDKLKYIILGKLLYRIAFS
ncbi:MAG: transposase, partial [Candidatus Cloacimonas sp.]